MSDRVHAMQCIITMRYSSAKENKWSNYCCTGSEESAKDIRKLLGVMDMFALLTVVMVSWVYRYVDIHQIKDFKHASFIVLQSTSYWNKGKTVSVCVGWVWDPAFLKSFLASTFQVSRQHFEKQDWKRYASHLLFSSLQVLSLIIPEATNLNRICLWSQRISLKINNLWLYHQFNALYKRAIVLWIFPPF